MRFTNEQKRVNRPFSFTSPSIRIRYPVHEVHIQYTHSHHQVYLNVVWSELLKILFFCCASICPLLLRIRTISSSWFLNICLIINRLLRVHHTNVCVCVCAARRESYSGGTSVLTWFRFEFA